MSSFISRLSMSVDKDRASTTLDITRQSAVKLKTTSTFKTLFVQQSQIARRNEYVTGHPLRIMAGTWNVNGKVPREDLTPWLNHHHEHDPDIIALGFQELDLSAETFVFNDSKLGSEWEGCVEKVLDVKKYRRLRSRQLVGMLLIVYVKESLAPYVTDVDQASTGCGIMHIMGNKGGVAIRMKVYESTICIVNSHLAAGISEVERRNQDIHEIMRRTVFSNARSARNTPLTIKDHDIQVWLGDLNYRLSHPSDAIKELTRKADWDMLYKYDQLREQRKLGLVFQNWNEAKINFVPTYKYDPGTDTFDTSEKQRAPAWCDRVLWKGGNPTVLSYDVHPEHVLSDHKPVTANLEFEVMKVDPELLKKVKNDILGTVDKMENDAIPDVQISCNQLDFGVCRYMEASQRTLTIENTGQVMLRFEFIPKMEEDSICRPWLDISPKTAVLLPGESIESTLTINVDRRTVQDLNAGKSKLEDIVIVHLINGKDLFVSIVGQFQPTFMGASLAELCSSPPACSPSPPKQQHLVDFERDMIHLVDGLAELHVQRDCLIKGWTSDHDDDGPALDRNHIQEHRLARLKRTEERIALISSTLESGTLNAKDGLPTPCDALVKLPSPEGTDELLVPVELWTIIDYLYMNDGLYTSGLFTQSGRPGEMEFVRRRLERGESLQWYTGSVHAVAEVMIQFLESFSEAVIPARLYTQCISNSGSAVLSKAILRELSMPHYNTFVYIMAFLREVVQKRAYNGMTSSKAGLLFQSVLLGSRKRPSGGDIKKRAAFLRHFL